MAGDLEGAKKTLGADEVAAKADTKHDWSKFIKDLGEDLKNPDFASKQAELKQEAQRLLKVAGFGDLTIDDVKDGKILEHKDGKAQAIDGTGVAADLAPQTPPDAIQKDDKGRVISAGTDNKFGYDDKDNSLNSITWPDPSDSSKTQSWTKKDGKWQNQDGTEVKFKQEPQVDQKTGDLSYQQDADKLTIDKAGGGTIIQNDDGTAATVTDKAGNSRTYTYEGGKLAKVDYKASGSTDADPAQSWTNKGDHWENNATPPDKRKDISVDPKTGDYTEINADGTKKNVIHTDGTNTTSDNKPDAPPAPPQKLSEPQQWKADRPGAVQHIQTETPTTDKVTIPHGGAMWDVATESLKKQGVDSTDPHFQSKVYKEIVRLARTDKNKDVFGDVSAQSDAQIMKGVASHLKAGTVIDISTDKPPAPPEPPANPNDAKGDRGQTLHYDDAKHTNLTGVDYKNGMKVSVDPTKGDVTVTGDPAGGADKDYKLVKQGDNTYKKMKSDGTTPVDPAETYSGVDLNHDDGTLTLTANDKSHKAIVSQDGTTTNIHYDGKGTDKTNITGVDYPNGMKTSVDPTKGDITVTGDPAGGADKDYKLVKQGDNTYKKMKSDGTTEVNPPQVYSGADFDNDDGTLTLTGKDNSHKATVHPDGTTTDIKYDGKGTAAENVTEIDYPNGMKATAQSGGAWDITGDPASGGKEYKLVKASDNSYSKENPDGSDFTKPPTTYSKLDVDAEDGSITLTGKKDGKDHTTTINGDGTTTEADVQPPPPQQPTADKAVVKADPNYPNKTGEIDYVDGTKATVTNDADGLKEIDWGTTSKLVKAGDHYELQPPGKAGDKINADGVTIDGDSGKVTMKGTHADGSKFYVVVGPDGKQTTADGDPA